MYVTDQKYNINNIELFITYHFRLSLQAFWKDSNYIIENIPVLKLLQNRICAVFTKNQILEKYSTNILKTIG